jgi:hypothetical protein
MKLLKTLTLGLLAAVTVGTASASPLIIHVSGSTAFRAGTTIALMDTLSGTTVAGGAGSTQVYGAANNTNVTSASQQIFANGTIGTGGTATIIVEAAWTGSLAGVVDLVCQTSTANFYDETNANVIAAVNGSPIASGTWLFASGAPGINLATSGNSHTSSTIEMAMSDAVKTTVSKELTVGATFSSGFSNVGPYASISALATACAGSSITDAGTNSYAQGAGTVAICPFEWVTGNITGGSSFSDGSSFTIPTNITQQAARQLLTAGYAPQALFTGLNTMADTQNFFFFTGRNEDSGTRILYLMEPQFGVTANPVQWAIGDGLTTTTGTTLYPITPLNTEPAIVWNRVGHSGYVGGGNVSSALKIAENGSVTFASGQQPSDATGNCYFISSLGLPDAATTIAGGGHAISYNGVAFSPAAVQNGAYTHWGFEHCYRLTAASTAVKTFVNNTADNIFASDCDIVYSTSTGAYHTEQSNGTYDSSKGQPVGVKFDGFCNVSRSTTEGGPVAPQY